MNPLSRGTAAVEPVFGGEPNADSNPTPSVAVIGAGPAGLMAAQTLAAAGIAVDLYDTMPSVGRKFLLAGIGGLNLTHSEPIDRFVGRYPQGRAQVARWLAAFGPDDVRVWAAGLGVPTFVGSSGRVFPLDMKAAPLLRAWLQRLRAAGVRIHTRHRWIGWADAASGSPGWPRRLCFATRSGPVEVAARACVLALGGASWPRLGSNGAWVELLERNGIAIAPLRASNCGFDVARPAPIERAARAREAVGTEAGGAREAVEAGAGIEAGEDGGRIHAVKAGADVEGVEVHGWSEHFRSRHAGHPLKTVALTVGDLSRPDFHRRGEFVITEGGVEGSLVYAAAAVIATSIAAHGRAVVHIDLLPDRSAGFVAGEVKRPRGSRSLATHLKSRLGIDGVKAALLHELLPRHAFADLDRLARSIKALPLSLVAARPIDEAISSAGGVRLDGLTDGLMLRDLPGIFCTGEMLDWDAPTGGYLLTACLASGAVAASGVQEWLGRA